MTDFKEVLRTVFLSSLIFLIPVSLFLVLFYFPDIYFFLGEMFS